MAAALSPQSRESSRDPGRKRPPDDRDAARADLGRYTTAGFQFGGVLLAFAGLGYWLDTRWSTLPLLTLVGAAIGGVGGFLHLYRSLTGGRERERSP
ncbi:MAG: AtpZ/AtpI family protein [Gemmatimonadetes bacterium]|nr:AtpZ/AtpI family protein [Gemmatimonadota bacterium]